MDRYLDSSDRDSAVDAAAILAIISLMVVTAVFWVSQQ